MTKIVAASPGPAANLAAREPGAPAGGGFIPLCVPNVTGSEWKYIKDCLDTGWVSSVGSYVDRFERETATASGARFGVAMASGTAALHVALLLAGVERDEEVIVPTLTFIASCNAVRYIGAWPALVDVDPDYWQLDPAKVADFLANKCRRDEGGVLRNTATSRRVKAILPVDVLGHPCDVDPLIALAKEYRLEVVEDATEALGALYRGRKVGSTSPVSCLSFNGNKLMTTGGGGMIVTDDEALARRAKYLTTQAKDDPVEFVHGAVGFNYRLTNIQAAMGCAQLEHLDEFVEAKRRIARRYAAELAQTPGLTPMREAEWARSTFWMYTMRVDPARFGRTSRELLAALESKKIQSRPLWQPMHQSPALTGSHAEPCPVAEALHADCLSLPCSTHLTEDEQARVIDAVREVARA
jgi:perosamine synthetase